MKTRGSGRPGLARAGRRHPSEVRSLGPVRHSTGTPRGGRFGTGAWLTAGASWSMRGIAQPVSRGLWRDPVPPGGCGPHRPKPQVQRSGPAVLAMETACGLLVVRPRRRPFRPRASVGFLIVNSRLSSLHADSAKGGTVWATPMPSGLAGRIPPAEPSPFQPAEVQLRGSRLCRSTDRQCVRCREFGAVAHAPPAQG